MQNEFWSWFAGFWEGEGSLSEQYDKSYSLDLMISQQGNKGKKAINYIKNQIGFGNIGSCKSPTGKIVWRYQVGKRPLVLKVLEKMIPYLIFRNQFVIKRFNKLQETEPLRKFWIQSEIEILTNEWKHKTDSELHELLPRHSIKSISWKRWTLGFYRQKSHKKAYDKVEILVSE